MAKKNITLSPYGCHQCTKRYNGDDGNQRCRETGYKTRFAVNARWHCKEFDLDTKMHEEQERGCGFCKETTVVRDSE